MRFADGSAGEGDESESDLRFGAGGLFSGAAFGVDGIAPAGAKATLSVQYRYESSGKQVGSGSAKYELHKWRSAYTVGMTAEPAAAKPLPLPSLQAADAAAMAAMQRQSARMQRTAGQTAPLMAEAKAIVAACREDEKCIEREIINNGSACPGRSRSARRSRRAATPRPRCSRRRPLPSPARPRARGALRDRRRRTHHPCGPRLHVAAELTLLA